MTEPLPQALIDTIERELLVRTRLAPADLLFVFGTRHGVAEFIEAIADLWRRGYFKAAIVTGGPTLGEARTEAEVISAGMAAAGVPAEVILTEHRATNTGENVIFSLPIIDAELGLRNVRSLIAVGKHCTSVRYLMTLERHWPEVDKMLAPVSHYGHAAEEWHLHPASRDRVLLEWRKLGPYRDAGFIADWRETPESHEDRGG
ncbi:uncharacterized SAM-binding protein YcdF (DUF218 family) [Caulobacter ginsengisoli]|uniref:Uncharacterized SAM-binding protein YcdF (DUF218 family) n=1 Tax=Caulobacter ginsengisoli TaxID=400775 RepID=A0ABU0IPN4_9CAUL|nr:YdcF family protein [Caulobacter ginsengisoli]MDQ0463971.1 uncharacterized SAM-binding protein YcdF (DUF218 family) [Caulobacter ginsengisoli]